MANTSRIAGLVPVQYLNGAAWNGQARTYFIPSSDTNAYAIGDPVDLGGTSDANGVPGIVAATAGNNSGANMLVGAIVGLGEQEDVIGTITTPNTITVPATKTRAYYALVADDPMLIFQMQEGGTQTTALAATNAGQNVDLASGANNGYVSGWVLDIATTTTGSGYQMKLIGLVRTSNNAFGTYAKWLAAINLHRYKAGVAGV